MRRQNMLSSWAQPTSSYVYMLQPERTDNVTFFHVVLQSLVERMLGKSRCLICVLFTLKFSTTTFSLLSYGRLRDAFNVQLSRRRR